MAQYGAAYRGKRITVDYRVDARSDLVDCTVSIDGIAYPDLRGNPFRSAMQAQTTGVAFARACIDAELDGNVAAHRGYFIRLSSNEQLDGSWVGSYQFHRNDNPMPFRRVSCEDFRGNTQVEAEAYALAASVQALDADIAAGKL